jgi:hypothetical protein
MSIDFKKLLIGTLSKKDFLKVFMPILLFQIIMWLIARLLYPEEGGFLLNYHQISRQGNPTMNPNGYLYFIIGTLVICFGLIFAFNFMFQRLYVEIKIFSSLFLILGWIGAIGLAMVAVFPEGTGSFNGDVHNIGSILAFGGLGLAAFLSYVIMFIRILKKYAWPSWSQLLLLFVIPLSILLQMPFSLPWSVFQWSGYNSVFTSLLGLLLIVPDEINNEKTNS